MIPPEEISRVADDVLAREALGLTCPICGEGDNFDRGGLVYHIDRCEEADRLRDEWAEQDRVFRENFIRKRVEPIADFARAIRAHLETTK